MQLYGNLCDDFYVNMNLSTEMDLPSNRETVLHFFERLQKSYPTMRNFYSRDKGDFVLEEDKDCGQYRWATIEPRRVSSGHVNPESVEGVLNQHRLILELAPFLLSVSPLDCEALDVLYGFDYTYRGNHNQLIADVLGIAPAFEKMADVRGARLINQEPSLTLALDPECRVQCRLSVETRTTAYHIRASEFPEEQFSVYFTARQYGSLGVGRSYVDAFNDLAQICHEMLESYVVENVLRPLQQAITLK